MKAARTNANDSTATLSSDVGGYELLVAGHDSAFAYPLPAEGDISLGRGEECDVRLASSSVSRRHAVLRIRASGLTLQDLGSSNGTFIRRERLSPQHETAVDPGESFCVGETVVVVRAWRSRNAAQYRRNSQLPADIAEAGVVLRSPPMLALYARTEPVARTNINVLILGETGVGKDVLARSIHERSARRAAPFLRVNCAALPEPLLESELFGHEKGAFTGAGQAKPGLLLAGTGGTVFFDEIGELPARLQPKLLQVLECREILSVGSVRPRPIDVRFIAATNADLKQGVASGDFRSDLYYRLAAFTAVIPPLRERPEDILPLAREFLGQASRTFERDSAIRLNDEAQARLLAHSWPGNVRELRNVIERAVVLCEGVTIGLEHIALEEPPPPAALPPTGAAAPPATPLFDLSARELEERGRILEALTRCAGNQSKAAELLGISRSTLVNRLDVYRIGRPRKRPGDR